MTRKASHTHRLGQHILTDKRILSLIVSAADISLRETVCEVGAGLGNLTNELCRVSKRVISYEVDEKIFKVASKSLSKCDNVELFNNDAFKAERREFDVFVSNLPYSRSRDAIEWLATSKMFNRAIIMVQSEFAQKLVASPGSKEYRSVSALSQYCFRQTRLFDVPRSSFLPEPKVDSTVIKLEPVRMLDVNRVKALNLLFSFRNKKASTLAKHVSMDQLPTGLNDDNRRIYQIGPEELIELAGLVEHVHSV